MPNLLRAAGSALLLLFLLAGCASPAQRIAQNQALFDSLPVAAQARIRGGQIDLGYTPDMTRIALGEPQRKLVRRTREGDTEIWLYLDTTTRYERQHADIDGFSVSGSGGVHTTSGSAWINVMQEKESVRILVEFKKGAIAAIVETPEEKSKP